MIEKVTKYVTEVIGHSYELNPLKMTKTRSKKPYGPTEIDPSRTFFCSELIAKLFKMIGIL